MNNVDGDALWGQIRRVREELRKLTRMVDDALYAPGVEFDEDAQQVRDSAVSFQVFRLGQLTARLEAEGLVAPADAPRLPRGWPPSGDRAG
jgi:hypothetical protein